MTNEQIIEKLDQCLHQGSLSSLYRHMGRYGEASSLLQDALSELQEHCIFSHEGLALTPKYLFDFSDRTSAVIPLESALWVFRLQDMRYSMRDKRDIMYYSMRIYTITGDKFVLKNRAKADLDEIEEVLTDRYPNFFYGYSEEHDRMVHYILEENAKELEALKRRKKKPSDASDE